MAQVAYDLEHFAPKVKKSKVIKVSTVSRKDVEHKMQLMRMMRMLFCAMVLVGLISAVLYTQATVTELQAQITQMEKELVEEEALYAYLSFEMDNKSSVRNIEKSASDMGLVRMNSGQVTYFRVDENNGIQLKKNPIEQFFDDTKAGFLSFWEYIQP